MIAESTAASPRRAPRPSRGRSSGPIGRARLALPGGLALSGVLLAFGATAHVAPAATTSYGELIATSRSAGVSGARADFHLVPEPRVFWLLVTGPPEMQLSIRWSITCSNPARGERGGASGKATLARGRWVKRIPAGWVTRPASCSGVVRASAERAPVQVRAYANSL
jgi:hypothetical protein